MTTDDWQERFGYVTVRVARIGGSGSRTLPDVPSQAWRRAARIVDAFGVDRALSILDARAERALLAGRIRSACNWRDIMAAIHAMAEDEREDGERDQ